MPTRILLVEDNRDILDSYAKALLGRLRPREWVITYPQTSDRNKLEVDRASSVPSAINKLRTNVYEILVVDLKIPGSSEEEMGGLEVISESISIDPLRPIIVITGYGSVELAKKTLSQGVFDFLEKSRMRLDDLVDAVQRAIQYRQEKIIRSGNPFTPGTGIEPTVFGGRTKELEFFEEKLIRALNTRFCDHLLVLGDWGIGKSTLLKEYKKICQSRGHTASVVPLEPLQAGTSLIEAARSIIEGILRDLPYNISLFKKLGKYLQSIGITVLGTGINISKNISDKDISPLSFLYNSLLNLWQDIKNRSEVLVILIDDLENFMSVPEILMTLKQTLSTETIRESKILFGLASTSISWLNLTSIEKHHPLARFFMSRVELLPLCEDELRETIIKSLKNTGVSFSSDIIGRIFEYTKGHPFEMQVLGSHLFRNQLYGRVELGAWDQALQGSLKDIGVAVFDNWFGQASAEEAKVLMILAKAEGAISLSEIKKIAVSAKMKIPPANIAKYLYRLVEKKLIIKSGRGFYIIPDKMFRAYLKSRS